MEMETDIIPFTFRLTCWDRHSLWSREYSGRQFDRSDAKLDPVLGRHTAVKMLESLWADVFKARREWRCCGKDCLASVTKNSGGVLLVDRFALDLDSEELGLSATVLPHCPICGWEVMKDGDGYFKRVDM